MYRRLKVTNKKLKGSLKRLRALLGLNVIIAVACGLGLVFFASLYVTEVKENAKLKDDLATIKDANDILVSEVSDANDTIIRLSKVATQLDKENTILVTTLTTQNEELETLREREELYDLYDYALTREDGSRTDITYEDIKSLHDLAIEAGLGEDAVAVVLAISMNESQGMAKVKNSKSTAAGLTGLLYGTAKFSYENLLGNGQGTYKWDYVYDASTNLKMSLAYISYLKQHTNGSTRSILIGYRGLYDQAYMDKIAEYVGKDISKIDL